MCASSFIARTGGGPWRWLIAGMVLVILGCDSDPVAIDDEESMCGPCGRVENGDATISGSAPIDGLFTAVGMLDSSVGSIRSDFNGRVRNLAGLFDVETGGRSTEAIVADIGAQFEDQIGVHLTDGVRVELVAPLCSVDIGVSATALAQCEAKGGCNVDVAASCDPNEISFQCGGKCVGGCAGNCDGSCTVKGASAADCDGTCVGACDLSTTPGLCEGTCKGACSGVCSLENAAGECQGECDADCDGSCVFFGAGGSCPGTCMGACTTTVADAVCAGDCSGSCDAECTGGCEGSFDPPSCDADASAVCGVSERCRSQAEAQASASIRCTSPQIGFRYEFVSGLDATAQAEVTGHLKGFETEMIGILEGTYKLRALLEGAPDQGIAPAAEIISDAVEVQVDSMVSGNLDDLVPGLVPCVVPALEESMTILVTIGSDAAEMASAQMDLMALLDAS